MHNCVYNSLLNFKKYTTPWTHYEIENFLDNDLHNFVRNFKYPSNDEIIATPTNYCTLRKFDKVSKILKGEQYKQTISDNRHSCEINFTQTFRQQYEHAQRLFDMFLDKTVLNFLEKIGNISLKDSFLRIQLIKDINGYSITPHVDYEKLFTLQCFFLTSTESDIGTILLSEREGDVVKRTIYKENTGTFFFPTKYKEKNTPVSDDDEVTWHSFRGNINVQRISLMINYFSNIPLGNNKITNKDTVFYKI